MRQIGLIVKFCYRYFPLPMKLKMRIKAALFRKFSDVFSESNAYRRWRMAEGESAAVIPAGSEMFAETSRDDSVAGKIYRAQLDAAKSGVGSDNYVAHDDFPLIDRNALSKLIAFYLPQFHPIPENNMWWGNGFTEWTNVSKAVPQFAGHYQPRLPGELGFYDLRLPEVMRRQIELAKHYGIHGFCFHYYWFSGKRLLESPLNIFLDDKEMDLPFCICWANENWTRRWDGQESDVLIGQKHCAEGDIDFLHDITPVVNDRRYIRIDGKPLVIVYRPSLLPNPIETTRSWREEAKKSGVGELFLVMVQFDELDPGKFGFDAAVEFPPHKIAQDMPCINDKLEIANPNYSGYVVDYRDILTWAAAVKRGDYTLIRGVFPGWDNEARKPGQGYTFHHSSPELYKTWLGQSLDFARKNPVHGEEIVFINAWNEWAEGAYLEPDRKYGYAYLQATRSALVKHKPMNAPNYASQPVLVIVHAYYPELLPEILASLRLWTIPYELHVSTAPEAAKRVRHELGSTGVPASMHVLNNRGRDICPFFEVLRAINAGEDRIVLKLHTKKSLHREDGEAWRMDLFSKLVNPQLAKKVFESMCTNEYLGMSGPEGHVLTLSSFWGSNEENVVSLSSKMGLSIPDPDEDAFVAGSMFWVKLKALKPLVQMNFKEVDFEPESGQVDGTLAHAIERLFTLTIVGSGYFLSLTGDPEVPVENTQKRYLYAKSSDLA